MFRTGIQTKKPSYTSPECHVSICPIGKEVRESSAGTARNDEDSQCLVGLQLEAYREAETNSWQHCELSHHADDGPHGLLSVSPQLERRSSADP